MFHKLHNEKLSLELKTHYLTLKKLNLRLLLKKRKFRKQQVAQQLWTKAMYHLLPLEVQNFQFQRVCQQLRCSRLVLERHPPLWVSLIFSQPRR